MTTPTVDELQRLVPRIVEVMRSYPRVPSLFGDPVLVLGLEFYPNGAFDLASLTIATVLRDLGFGDWELVSAFDEDGKRHTWLRLRRSGEIVLSVDATLHQFDEWERPWIGAGDSPVVARFKRPVHVHPPMSIHCPSCRRAGRLQTTSTSRLERQGF